MNQLSEAQRKLVSGMQMTGPARWALRSVVNKHANTLRESVTVYMLEALSFKLHHEGVEKVKGLLVCPAANMHHWWAAGWHGPAMSSVQFMNSDAILAETFDCVVFDVQANYPAKFIEHLDVFLAEPNAPQGVFWLPALGEGEEPQWMSPLLAVLAKHRFVILRID